MDLLLLQLGLSFLSVNALCDKAGVIRRSSVLFLVNESSGLIHIETSFGEIRLVYKSVSEVSSS